ncbi:hypothetical protein VTK73DRAFT_2800 [Phialemonium thermophilum]|uniref:Uncharacterized protein n=1 Tax=Phialemonium thermophilum TaxID=223376 RepID=A0ABR3X3D3_9PEZI
MLPLSARKRRKLCCKGLTDSSRLFLKPTFFFFFLTFRRPNSPRRIFVDQYSTSERRAGSPPPFRVTKMVTLTTIHSLFAPDLMRSCVVLL